MNGKLGLRSFVLWLWGFVFNRFVGGGCVRLKLWKVFLVNSEIEFLKVLDGGLWEVLDDLVMNKILFLKIEICSSVVRVLFFKLWVSLRKEGDSRGSFLSSEVEIVNK